MASSTDTIRTDVNTLMSGDLTVTRSLVDGRAYYEILPAKGANTYTLSRNPRGEWELWTQRTNINRRVPGIHFYASLTDVDASRKCLRGLSFIIASLDRMTA